VPKPECIVFLRNQFVYVFKRKMLGSKLLRSPGKVQCRNLQHLQSYFQVRLLEGAPQASTFICLRSFDPIASGRAPFQARGLATGVPPLPAGNHQQATTTTTLDKQVLYRGRGIRTFRLLVRAKVFQLSGIAALAIPLNTVFTGGSISPLHATIAASLVLGSGVASAALWYYSRRYLGEVALVQRTIKGGSGEAGNAEDAPALRLSTLDFWGNREETHAALEDVIPPLAGLTPAAWLAAAYEPVLPLEVAGDRKYILSLRYGHIVDREGLMALLQGRFPAGGGMAESSSTVPASKDNQPVVE
jgi:hypothetical protein